MTPSCAGSSSKKGAEVIDLTSVEIQGSRADNRKRKQAISCDVIEIIDNEVQDEVVITVEEGKNKAKIMGLAEEWHKQVKDALATDLLELKQEQMLSDPAPSALMEAQDLDYFEKYHEDYADSDEDAYMYSIEEDDDLYLHGNNDDKYAEYVDDLYISAQLDSVDLPPGQEASFPWLQHLDAGPSEAVKGASAFCLSRSSCKGKNQKQEVEKQQGTGSSNGQSSSNQTVLEKKEKGVESEVERKFNLFMQFNAVRDFSDHHYGGPNNSCSKSLSGGLAKEVPKDWSLTIQNEWKLLEKDLPDTIFVRVFEERLDLLRAVIVGAAGTPYHDGLFFFDVCFPSSYPEDPPLVYYHSGGLRLNPNLYNCGKVCLSLLNTWHGNKNEMWTPGKSTMLQVLLSIQALVLNAKPYFNEPGWASGAGNPEGEKKAQDYNETTFLLSCKTMMYALRRPPKHFEDLVAGHFQQRAHAILESCKAYMDGAQVGCLASGGIQDVDEGDKSCSVGFRTAVREIFPKLIKAFTGNGSDCSKFLS